MEVYYLVFLTIFIWSLKNMLKWYQKRKRIWDAIEPYGGEQWYPIIGTCLDLIKSTAENFYQTIAERDLKYGPTFRTWMGSIPTLHLTKPEDIECVLNNTSHLEKGNFYKFTMPWLGNGLISTSNVKLWHHHRRLLTPTFHFSILDNMVEVMTEKGQMLADMLEKKADGKFFNIYNYLTLCELDVICETAMGVEVNAMKDSDSEYVRSIYGVVEIMVHRIFHPYLHPDFIFNLTAKGRQQKKYLSILHDFTNKVIQQRKARLTAARGFQRELSEEDKSLGKKQRLAFLDLLLEANKKEGGLTNEEIREEVDTFMFAGHDTTTVTVAWTLLALANYPEHQEKVHQELDEIFQGEERLITPQDILEMQYLDKVIKESMRILPIVPIIGRALTNDLKIVSGDRIIPAGVQLVLHFARLHKDPQQYPDPERFDPDRFLPENIAKRHPYSFLPFSAGPRNCLGQKFASRNSKIALAHILRKFKVRSEKKIDEIKFVMGLVLRPQGGLNIALEPRNK